MNPAKSIVRTNDLMVIRDPYVMLGLSSHCIGSGNPNGKNA
jgi:hypothetical protein